MSEFDDLMNLGETTQNSNQSADLFDLLGGPTLTTNQNNANNNGGSLLDLGFDAQVSTNNGQSGSVEINTNPLYEFTKSNDSQDIMASENDNSALLDFGSDPVPQKEVKSDPSANPLYDFIESENTNGHAEDILTNGDTAQTMDLLDDSTADLLGGPITVTSDDSGVTLDMNNVSETQREEDFETEENVEDKVEDNVEDVKVEEEGEQDEIEDDQDTGNVEEISSEQITEPVTEQEEDDQLEEQEKQEEPMEEENDMNVGVNEPASVSEMQDKPEALSTEGTNDEEVKDVLTENVKEEKTSVEDDHKKHLDNAEVVDIKKNVDDAQTVEAECAETEGESQQDETPQPVAEDDIEGPDVIPVQDNKNDETEEQAIMAETEQPKETQPEPIETDQIEDDADVLETLQTVTEETPEEVPEPDIEVEQSEPDQEGDLEPTTVVPNDEAEESEPVSQDDQVIEQEPVPVVPEEKIEPAYESTAETGPKLVEESEPAEVMDEEPEPEQVSEAFVDQTPEVGTLTEEDPVENIEPAPAQVLESEQASVAESVVENTEADCAEVANNNTEADEPADSVLADVEEDIPVEEPVPVEKSIPMEEPALEVESTPVEEQVPLDETIETVPVEEPIPDAVKEPENLASVDGNKQMKEEEPVKETPVDTKTPEENAAKVNDTTEVKENGVSEDEVIRDPNVFRETHEKEEVRFAEMSNVRQKFESGTVKEDDATPKKKSVKEEYDEGGEFENTPAVNEDVVKETDHQKEELPEIGMAKNLLNRFKSLQEESAQTVTSQKRNSPPRDEKVEYENQPSEKNIVYEGKSEEGVFESNPAPNENVVRSGDKTEEINPEKGHTKNVLNRFKEIETGSGEFKAREKRELTPDKSGKVEYVSEPRGQHITYEDTKSEEGVFENVPQQEEDVVRSGDKTEEVMPESGLAMNMLSKFKQMESETANQTPPSPKRGKPYQPKPKEQKGYLERFSPKLEEGEFENQPVVPAEVVRSGDHQEDFKPETGAAKKTMERFKEMEKQGGSPKSPDYRKDFTPPRETSPGKTVAGVLENEPVCRPDVIRNADRTVDEMPEAGSAKNILERFKQIQSAENSPSSSPTKKFKEFTPPPESGVYENTPKDHLVIEQRQSEAGVLESTPGKSNADVPRGNDREAESPEKELPEKGMAKNLVSKFKQLETESAKNSNSVSPRFKEFTPPRDTRNILSPKSPAEHQNGVCPSDLPEQYQEQTSPGIFESLPEQRKDVYREADTDWEQGLPAKNTTLSMLEKFRNIQHKAKEDEETPSAVSRKDDTPSPHDNEEKGMFRVVQTEKCAACQKTVYAMEKLEMNGHTYHKNCFKCSHCSARLTPKTFSMNEGVIYCTNHFKQLFARKGNYDEGFGRQQYKKKWQDEKSKTDESTANA